MPTIRRVAYTRRSPTGRRVHVKSAMIKNLGRPGHGPKTLPTPKAGMLSMWGYSTAASPQARRNALVRAIKTGGQSPATVLRRLKLVELLTKRSQRKASHMYKNNRLWLRSKYVSA